MSETTTPTQERQHKYVIMNTDRNNLVSLKVLLFCFFGGEYTLQTYVPYSKLTFSKTSNTHFRNNTGNDKVISGDYIYNENNFTKITPKQISELALVQTLQISH